MPEIEHPERARTPLFLPQQIQSITFSYIKPAIESVELRGTSHFEQKPVGKSRPLK